ncbi:hypothetical protein BPAE_0005g00740 [Botrytis paeoniae]|uniref:Uncharacterized protein n=1 Tax=Botrytis paeoniae TaxID=278948 RepID=A0A4Z1G3Y3_9HELO|nr:hypothetical protein BPAE_0005g00740 [Botrytis paeoniae]
MTMTRALVYSVARGMGQYRKHQDLGRRRSNESRGKPSLVGNAEDGGIEMECCWANSTPSASKLK